MEAWWASGSEQWEMERFLSATVHTTPKTLKLLFPFQGFLPFVPNGCLPLNAKTFEKQFMLQDFHSGRGRQTLPHHPAWAQRLMAAISKPEKYTSYIFNFMSRLTLKRTSLRKCGLKVSWERGFLRNNVGGEVFLFALLYCELPWELWMKFTERSRRKHRKTADASSTIPFYLKVSNLYCWHCVKY